MMVSSLAIVMENLFDFKLNYRVQLVYLIYYSGRRMIRDQHGYGKPQGKSGVFNGYGLGFDICTPTYTCTPVYPNPYPSGGDTGWLCGVGHQYKDQ